ncbi:anti-sigma factor [Paenibacillus rubinfantis]|uniref:anti-sigma factor n=1 Tax=Paenibacillus rubinfantis TaxID=1720296 RepID=UPI00073EFFF7|nr:anti-sigma factor [Paenibacillus rubinfantis]
MNGQADPKDKDRKLGGPKLLDLCVRMYTEQEWIDWLLGTLGEAKCSEMAKHLDTCTVCLEQKMYWQDVLGIGGEGALVQGISGMQERQGMQDVPDVQGMSDLPRVSAVGQPDPAMPVARGMGANRQKQAEASTGERLDPWADAVPSERIRRSLRGRVRRIGWRRRAVQLLTIRWKWTISLAAALMVLIGLGFALDNLNQPEASWDRYVQTYEPDALPVLSKPDTISYPIAMGRLEPENGRVWYNEATREMLMLVGGLVPDRGQTIRVWIVKEGARDSLGLLQYHANRAHLYVKDKTLGNGDSLELTIEPAYGTPEVQEAPIPNSISLDLLGR